MQVRVARMSTFGVGAVAILFGLLAQGLNVAVPVVLAIAVAASSNFPILFAVVLSLIGPAFLEEDAVFPLVNPPS